MRARDRYQQTLLVKTYMLPLMRDNNRWWNTMRTVKHVSWIRTEVKRAAGTSLWVMRDPMEHGRSILIWYRSYAIDLDGAIQGSSHDYRGLL